MENRGGQVTRQWRLLRMLDAARAPLTAMQMWEMLDEGVNERTIRRDLAQLEEAGWPLDRNSDGGWTIDGSVAVANPIKTTHLLALMLAADLFQPLHGTPLQSAFDELRQNLQATLNPTRRAYLDALRTQAAATLFNVPNYQEHSEILEDLQTAIAEEQQIEIDYDKPNAPSARRVVDPYGTWVANGRIYLVSFCRQATAIRTFALQRIRAVRLLDASFERDPTFDMGAFARKGFGVHHGPVHEVALRWDAEVAHLARERRFHESQCIRELGCGSLLMTFTASGLPEIAAWLAGFGGRVQVEQPHELREQVLSLHRRAIERISITE